MDEPVRSYNKICGRLCVEMEGRLASPLSIGSGEQEHTDADLVFNAKGEPYIPGSSLAGAFRAYANAVKGEDEANRLFGTPKDGVPGRKDDRQSRIFLYDAVLTQGEVGIRDGVKLDGNKTASYMGKYELQFVGQGAHIKIRAEILERKDCLEGMQSIREAWEKDLEWIEMWRHGFAEGELRLGSRNRRGFGRVEIDRVRIKRFDMQDKASYLEWLDWDWEQEDAFGGKEGGELCIGGARMADGVRMEHCLEIPLHLPGTLLVRTYAAVFARTGDIQNYGQMTVGGAGKQATIPGSSIAGAFRSHIADIVKELGNLPSWEEAQRRLDPVFGTWTDTRERKRDLRASRLIFEETVVDGGHGLPTSRIAVDRFTGGTVQGALFEEAPWVGGDAVLRIRWRKGGENPEDKAICGMLLWAVKDLQTGILPLGGETSVGRGICEPQEAKPRLLLDGELFAEAEQRECMQAAALWVRGVETDENAGRHEDGEIRADRKHIRAGG